MTCIEWRQLIIPKAHETNVFPASSQAIEVECHAIFSSGLHLTLLALAWLLSPPSSHHIVVTEAFANRG